MAWYVFVEAWRRPQRAGLLVCRSRVRVARVGVRACVCRHAAPRRVPVRWEPRQLSCVISESHWVCVSVGQGPCSAEDYDSTGPHTLI